MKYLLVLAVLVIAYGVWRSGRRAQRAAPPRPRTAPPALMVACARCGTHVPGADAHSQRGQWYCSADHARKGPV